MGARGIVILGLVTFAVIVHAGCSSEPYPCEPGENGPYDNRDRKTFPTVDADWICVVPWPRPVFPDLGEYKNDDVGAQYPSLAPRAAVFIESCIGDALPSHFNINARIDAMYGAVMESAFEREISRSGTCFAAKTNGCQAVQECLGIVIQPHQPALAPNCYGGGIAVSRIETEPGLVRDLFVNCYGLGLDCYPLPEPWCGPRWDECPEEGPTCDFGWGEEPRNCRYSDAESKILGYDSVDCSKFELSCAVEDSEAKCIGAGTTCSPTYIPTGEYLADFRSGIACENASTLRACVNGHEQLLNCGSRGVGLGCIDGPRPHCALDSQCDDGTHPLPTCDGTSIIVCNAGVRTKIDCAVLGFETCDPVRGVCKP